MPCFLLFPLFFGSQTLRLFLRSIALRFAGFPLCPYILGAECGWIALFEEANMDTEILFLYQIKVQADSDVEWVGACRAETPEEALSYAEKEHLVGLEGAFDYSLWQVRGSVEYPGAFVRVPGSRSEGTLDR